MKVFGLTGKSGAGKSTLAQALQKSGFLVIDGDVIAREITKKGSPVLLKLAERFGSDIINNDGTLNRKLLAFRAFSNEGNRQSLNHITHAAIDEEIQKRIAKGKNEGFRFAVIDAAALLESPSKALCEKIIVVSANKETRLRRILSRDDITEEEALRRINAQKDDEFYLSQADYIFSNNNGDNFQENFNRLLSYLT